MRLLGYRWSGYRWSGYRWSAATTRVGLDTIEV